MATEERRLRKRGASAGGARRRRISSAALRISVRRRNEWRRLEEIRQIGGAR
jgi:hypothetical protein